METKGILKYRNALFSILAALLIMSLFLCERVETDIETNSWAQNIGGSTYESGNNVIQTSDGGYLVAGYTSSNNVDVSGNNGGYDYWIIKLNTNGEIEWQKCYGGSNNDEAHSVIQSSDGGYVVAGYSSSNDKNVSGNHGGYDYWVIKLSPNGELEWQKCYGGNSSDYAKSITQTLDGGFLVAGYTRSNNGDVSGNHGYTDYWVLKLSSNGNIEWQKCYGGIREEEAHSVIQSSDGKYIVAGYTFSNNGDVSGNHGGYDYWVIKLKISGDIEWQKCYGGSSYDKAHSICPSSDGGCIIVGHSYSQNGDVSGNHGRYDYWVIKLNTNGEIDWKKCYGGNEDEEAYSVIQTLDGGYAVAGYAKSNDGDVSGNNGYKDYWIVKLNSEGNIEWQKCYGGNKNDIPYSIIQTTEGGYIVVGYTESENGDVIENYGDQDIWILKLDENGNIDTP
jgi:uncharacterized delta-60 repeat protein